MKTIFYFFSILFLLGSCGDATNRTMQENVSAFLNDNEKAVVFGKVDVKALQNKAEIANIPIYGPIIKEVLKGFENSLNMESPLYFAMEGPINEGNVEGAVYMFAEVKDKDSLVKRLTKQGFDVNQVDDISTMQDGEMGIGVRNNLAIVVIKEQFEAKTLLPEVFKRCTGELSGETVENILNDKGDFVLGMDLENLFEQGTNGFAELSAGDKKKTMELLDDSYLQSSLHFEKGSIRLETKNHFNDVLQKSLFLKSDPSGKMVTKLGTGRPRIGFAVNVDMKKIDKLLNKYASSLMKQFKEGLGGPAAVTMLVGGDNPLSSLATGELAGVLLGEPHSMDEVKDFNFYVGLGPNGKTLMQDGQNMLSLWLHKVILSGNGISGYSSEKYAPGNGKKLFLPGDFQFFGKKGITAFVDLEGVDMETFGLEGEEKLAELLKSITFEADNNGTVLNLRLRNAGTNSLKQIVDFFLKEMSNDMQSFL
jgi:hypothetical protein